MNLRERAARAAHLSRKLLYFLKIAQLVLGAPLSRELETRGFIGLMA
jgi:hypothetical protein